MGLLSYYERCMIHMQLNIQLAVLKYLFNNGYITADELTKAEDKLMKQYSEEQPK